MLVPENDPDGLARALREDLSRFDPEEIRANARRFSRARFQARLRELVAETCASPAGR